MKLLYAEDEIGMSEAVVDILTYHKYIVDAVYDGEEALAYRGLTMQVAFTMFDYELTLKGQMTYKIDLGTDPRGNIQRIENELARIPVRLQSAENQLSNLYAQVEATKAEVGKPFSHEEELQLKTARLVELNTELNLEGQSHTEQTVAKSARPSVLDKLKAPCVYGTSEKKKSHELEVR